MDGISSDIEIVEVAPRDGLQSDGATLSTATKVELIERCMGAGLRRIEVASFVNPKRVPQMADAEAVLEALPERDDVSYIGLVLNRRGMERAAATKVDEINAVVAATEEFAHRNQGMSLDDTIATAADVIAAAREAGLASSVTVSTAFGCPYEFEVPVDALAEVARRVADARPDEIALADTIGVAVPTDVRARIDAVRAAIDPAVRLRVHFHNTRNTGLANVAAAVEVGIGVVDASLGGIGGCPFAPNATGNVPTEDVVYLLERMGHRTGVDLDVLLGEVAWLEATLDRAVPGLMAKAGTFPN